jgi:hypothetical protein
LLAAPAFLDQRVEARHDVVPAVFFERRDALFGEGVPLVAEVLEQLRVAVGREGVVVVEDDGEAVVKGLGSGHSGCGRLGVWESGGE